VQRLETVREARRAEHRVEQYPPPVRIAGILGRAAQAPPVRTQVEEGDVAAPSLGIQVLEAQVARDPALDLERRAVAERGDVPGGRLERAAPGAAERIPAR
jgi:hypothetical protein